MPYIKNRLPVSFTTDLNTDVGKKAELYDYGFYYESAILLIFENLLIYSYSTTSLESKLDLIDINDLKETLMSSIHIYLKLKNNVQK